MWVTSIFAQTAAFSLCFKGFMGIEVRALQLLLQLQTHRIHAETFARGRGTVIEDMTQMGVTFRTQYFSTIHTIFRTGSKTPPE